VTAALERLRAQGDNRAACWNSLLYLWLLGPLAFALVLALHTLARSISREEAADWSLSGPAIVILIVFSIFASATALIYSKLLRDRIRQSLAGSQIAERIASRSLEQDTIFEYTPWPWRKLLPQGNDLSSQLTRMAANLDWYMLPPRRMLRPLWIFNILCLLILCAAGAVLLVGLASGGGLVNIPALILLGLGLVLSIPQSFMQHRRQLWTSELARYLRERLDS
jgi:hypothetical protein